MYNNCHQIVTRFELPSTITLTKSFHMSPNLLEFSSTTIITSAVKPKIIITNMYNRLTFLPTFTVVGTSFHFIPFHFTRVDSFMAMKWW